MKWQSFAWSGERDQLISNSFFNRRCCGRRRRGYLNSLLSEGRYLQDLLSTVKFSSTLKGGATLLQLSAVLLSTAMKSCMFSPLLFNFFVSWFINVRFVLQWRKDTQISTILFLCFLLSFWFHWEDTSSTQNSVWPYFQTPRSSSKNFLRVVFSILFSVFRNVVKHGLLWSRSYLRVQQAVKHHIGLQVR